MPENRARQDLPPPKVNTCGNWAAWHDFMPGKPPTLYVVGQCTFPIPAFTVLLRHHVPQGVNPAILILDKVVMPPTEPQPEVVTTGEARFEEQTSARYSQVTILPDGVTLDVQIVQ
jgi:hypothetical protein